MDYTTAIGAVEGASAQDPQYASRTSWPAGVFVEYQNGQLFKSSGQGTNPYTPTSQDLNAQDWMYGGDKPPR